MMIVLFLVFSCVSSQNISQGRSVQAVIGRNVSFSFTLTNVTKDAVSIYHDGALVLWVWPNKDQFVVPGKRNKVHLCEDVYPGETVILNITLLNITKEDVGMYTAVGQRNSNHFKDSVFIRKIEETMIPRIHIVRHMTSDSSLVLQCFSFRFFTGRFIWRLNATMINNFGRYAHNKDSLEIGNVTSDDQYNQYTCMEHENEVESYPFRIKPSGPSAIIFIPDVPVIIEYESLNVSCNSDCDPICTWQWTNADPLSGLAKTVSTNNTLQIQNITRSDAGKYSCKVKNVLSGTVNTACLSVDVIYGPDELLLNATNSITEMDESDSVTIICSADCFPECQISWSESTIEIPGSALSLKNVKDDKNFTCFARNARNANTTIHKTILIRVRSGNNYYMTTSRYKEEDREDNVIYSNQLLIYLVLPLGAMSATGLFACFLLKCFKCLRTGTGPSAISNQYSGEDNPHKGDQSESYWTIVSNALGEMRTELETNTTQMIEPTHICSESLAEVNKIEESSQLHRIEVDLELDGYIHPIHSDLLSTGSSRRHTTEV